MAKSFKKSNPLDTFSQMEVVAAQATPHNEQEEERPAAISTNTNTKKKTNSDYLRLDVYGYKDYLQTMSGHAKKSVTKYIHGLIESDMERNRETYEKLKSI